MHAAQKTLQATYDRLSSLSRRAMVSFTQGSRLLPNENSLERLFYGFGIALNLQIYSKTN